MNTNGKMNAYMHIPYRIFSKQIMISMKKKYKANKFLYHLTLHTTPPNLKNLKRILILIRNSIYVKKRFGKIDAPSKK